jgi:hypothetical protein
MMSRKGRAYGAVRDIIRRRHPSVARRVTEGMGVMGKVLLVACTLLAALMFGAAGAYFTGQAQVPENVISAGSVAISTEPTASALTVAALAPGATATKPLTVVNTGKKAGITEFYEALTVRVVADGVALYDGPLSTMRTSPVSLAAGARAQLQFALGIPATAGNELAGDYAKLTLYVDAEQVR